MNTPPPPRPGRRPTPYTTRIDLELQEHVRRLVRHISARTGRQYSLAQFTEDALRHYSEYLTGAPDPVASDIAGVERRQPLQRPA